MNINREIASLFNNIGNMLDVLGDNPFKIRAYKNASRTIMDLDRDLTSLAEKNEIHNIKGIGKDLEKKIREYIETGKIVYYEELKLKVPEEVLDVLSIQGIGPKLLGTLYKDFDVKSIEDLENIIDTKELKEAKGIGTKKLNEIKVGIKLFKSHLDKINLGFALPIAEQVLTDILALKPVAKAEITGEIRRGKESVNSLDIIALSNKIDAAIKSVSALPYCHKIINSGKNSLSVILEGNLPLNIRFTGKKEFINTVFISTGSKKHIEKLRALGSRSKVDIDKGKFNSERNLYEAYNIQYIPPELREGADEIESALKYGIPDLIELHDIKGDLHTHCNWSDGRSTIDEMAEAAKTLGYEYIAITDHSISSRIANGLDVERLIKKNIELQKVDKDIEGIKILMGSEVDIKPDGSLDYPDQVLRELDIVIASIHSSFKMEEDEMTDRLIRALKNPYVSALGHPTGRLIGERNPYKLNMDEVIYTAKKHGKALEVNASYMRLDLKDEHVRKALEKGVKLIISTDAHHTEQLLHMRYGIITAKRGWASIGDVINTKKLTDLKDWINNFK